MKTQEFLKQYGIKQLQEQLGIKICQHETLPIMILNYNQIESPKTNPIAKECRGLVLHSETFELIARAFDRFFNWGEAQDEYKLFDFNHAWCENKEDGSLINLFCFDGQWMITTRQSFATSETIPGGPNWQELFLKAIYAENFNQVGAFLDPERTYVFELCSVFNKIVRYYPEPVAYLLTISGKSELSSKECDELVQKLQQNNFNVKRPERTEFSGINQLANWMKKMENNDPTFEGVVLRDINNLRIKYKSSTYVALHRLSNNSTGFSPQHLVPLILSGETEEVVSYFPEAKDKIEEVANKIQEAYEKLFQVWNEGRKVSLDQQKEFALTILGKTPFTGILFNLRKQYGENENEEYLKQAWRNSGEFIVKALFK